ncbi:hypothetical protein BUALT_Bualt02G0111500 [Buddleja alternifolia]|uniref:Ty3 transposon capsid-like protein domain-containing protein n=1 Tax=Buddleja alternifolia TaxID=168488 RepID=A0AAV6Y1F7_9LAMI|nr:hypothetical protein BUALT_Bualt02G0111500 [Buddleja alternifolia]
MADSTRLKDVLEHQKKQEILLIEEKALREASQQHIQVQFENMANVQSSLKGSMATVEENQKLLQQQMQGIIDQLQAYNRNKSLLGAGLTANPDHGSTSQPPPTRTRLHDSEGTGNQSTFSPFPRVEFPKFGGADPRTWVRKCARYFQIVSTVPEDQKVPLASVHLEGRAELWFQGYLERGVMPTWNQFLQAIYDRFDDTDPELMIGEFNKLHQTGTVTEYLEKFEDLKSHMLLFHREFPEDFFIASFVSGLRDDIQGAVLSMKPNTLHQAISLAKKQETTKLPPPKPPFKPPEHSQPTRRLLTAAEMRARREKNLCYNCDEVYVPGHRCKNRQIFLIMTEEEEEAYTADANQIEFQDEGVALEDMTVSLNAMSGTTNMNTLRMRGTSYNQEIHFLIDSGSTNCFLDEETALRLGCIVEYTTPMMVSVANGSKLISRTYSPEFTWSIQGQSFTYPVRIIKLGGCDLVLGGDWLRKYSPIEFDYDKMKLTISRSGKKIALKAITENSELKLISAKFPQFNMQPALQTQHSSPLQVHMSADPTHTSLEFSTAPPHLDSTTANQLSNEPALNSISQDFPQDATLSPSAKISVAVQHLQDHIFSQSVSSITPTTSKIRHSHTQPIQILTTSIHSTTNLSTQSPNFDPPFLHNFPPCGQGFQNPRGNVTITGRIGTFDFNRSIAKKIRSHRSRRIKDYKTSRTDIKDLNDNVQLMSCLSQDSPHHHPNDAVSINANSAHTHVPPSDEFHPTITKDSTSSI